MKKFLLIFIICSIGLSFSSCNDQQKEELYSIMNQQLVENSYTTETYEKYKSAYNNAESVYNNYFSSKSKLDSVQSELVAAINNLEIASNGIYQINYSFNLIENNSVGNEWEKNFTLNNTNFNSGNTITMPLGSVTEAEVSLIENDKYPDVTSADLLIPLEDGTIISELVTVTENHGQYKGSIAVWQVTIKVSLIERI